MCDRVETPIPSKEKGDDQPKKGDDQLKKGDDQPKGGWQPQKGGGGSIPILTISY